MVSFINTQFEKKVIRLIDDNTQYSQELKYLHKLINNAEYIKIKNQLMATMTCAIRIS